MPLGKADHDEHQHRQQNKKLESCGELSHQLNAAHVDVSNHRDHGERDKIMSPARQFGKIEAEVIGKLYGVNAAQQK